MEIDQIWDVLASLDIPVQSPFHSVDFLVRMNEILRHDRCSITAECHLPGDHRQRVVLRINIFFFFRSSSRCRLVSVLHYGEIPSQSGVSVCEHRLVFIRREERRSGLSSSHVVDRLHRSNDERERSSVPTSLRCSEQRSFVLLNWLPIWMARVVVFSINCFSFTFWSSSKFISRLSSKAITRAKVNWILGCKHVCWISVKNWETNWPRSSMSSHHRITFSIQSWAKRTAKSIKQSNRPFETTRRPSPSHRGWRAKNGVNSEKRTWKRQWREEERFHRELSRFR